LGVSMRKITAFVLFIVLLLAACRSEPERSVMAQVPEGADDAAATSVTVGRTTPDPTLRRLWTGSDFNFFASQPSPDGRWVTEIDWDTGDLAVRDLTTGRLHRLTDKGPWVESAAYAEVGRFSPDGRRIAYSWFVEETGTYEIRLLDFSLDEAGVPRGSEPRVVHPGGAQYAYWLYGWTSEDELLVGLYRLDNSTALGFLSLEDGAVRVLKSFDWTDPRASLSPDGRFIAYDHSGDRDPRERDIYLLAADGSIETTLVEDPGTDRVLGWVPGDGSLLFHSERSGTPSVWRLPMRDGEPTGKPELVREDIRNLEPLGFAGQAFYFGVEVDFPAYRTARIDFEGRRLVGPSTTFAAPYGANTTLSALDWSPDGEHVAQEVRHGPERTDIVLRSVDGTLIDEWPLQLRLLRSMVRWAPDGESLFFTAQDVRGRAGFFRLELDSGSLELVRRFDPESGLLFSISPDGRSLYFTRIAPDRGEADTRVIEIMARDLESGTDRVIRRLPGQGVQLGASHWSPLAVSPDGGSIAYPEIDPDVGTTIQLLPLDGRPPRALHVVALPSVVAEIVGWEPDGEHLLVLVTVEAGESADEDEGSWSVADVELWRIPREGGNAEPIATIRDHRFGARLHPDGRTLAYRAGRARGEIWAMDGLAENLDPVTRERAEDSR
jgi:Tol biopolymer transport system component